MTNFGTTVTKGPTTMATATKDSPQTQTDAPPADPPADTTQVVDGAATSTDTPKGGKRPRPVYAAEKVSELPADATLPRGGPRTDPAFIEALQTAQADPGEFYCVATFMSPGGAKTLLKRIQKKDTKVPAGEWDFEARRIAAPESTDANPVRWSKLYAKYLG